MDIITKADAKARGLIRYFDPLPCRTYGHVSERYVSTGGCIQCFEQLDPAKRAHQNMLNRCYNPKASGYKNYGARGIKVCDGWLGENGYANFLMDLGPRPVGLTLQRNDTDGDYCPQNCQWSTWHVQHRTKRTNVKVELDGRQICFEDAARSIGVCSNTIRARTKAQNISLQESLDYYRTHDPIISGWNCHKLQLDGQIVSLTQAGIILGRDRRTIYYIAKHQFDGDLQAAVDALAHQEVTRLVGSFGPAI